MLAMVLSVAVLLLRVLALVTGPAMVYFAYVYAMRVLTDGPIGWWLLLVLGWLISWRIFSPGGGCGCVATLWIPVLPILAWKMIEAGDWWAVPLLGLPWGAAWLADRLDY